MHRICLDTPCNLKMLQWLLLLNAVKSTSAVNGYEAILAFERADPSFDLIFMDNTMPVMVSKVLTIHLALHCIALKQDYHEWSGVKWSVSRCLYY
jgi:CheY-like chemotaxis protein